MKKQINTEFEKSNNMRSKRVFLLLAVFMLSMSAYAQTATYQMVKSESVSSSVVKLTLMVYGKSKKTIDADAQYAAVRAALFDGCPNTAYSKPLLDMGETAAFRQYPNYFESLYYDSLSDFISGCLAMSKFKGGDKKKGTLYEVQVKVLLLRKDLEKNGIRTKMGI